jgi:hypothetical protein
MNKDLERRVAEQLALYARATLATYGPAALQISTVSMQAHHLRLYLLLPHGSDHLFNLETLPEIVLLSPRWKLRGRAVVLHDGPVTAAQPWHAVIQVEPVQLDLLDENGDGSLETIDF